MLNKSRLQKLIVIPNNPELMKVQSKLRVANDFTKTVIFRNVSAIPELKEFKLDKSKTLYSEYLKNLPYDDITLLIDFESYDDNNVISDHVNEGLFIRVVTDRKVNRCLIFLYHAIGANFQNNTYPTKMVLGDILTVDLTDDRLFHINTIARKDINADKQIKEFAAAALAILVGFAEYYKNLEIETDDSALRSYKVKKLPKEVQKTYIEHTVKLFKRKPSESNRGGTHERPVEHTRRGHWRTLKSGKQIFINQITVNKGYKPGNDKKEYTL